MSSASGLWSTLYEHLRHPEFCHDRGKDAACCKGVAGLASMVAGVAAVIFLVYGVTSMLTSGLLLLGALCAYQAYIISRNIEDLSSHGEQLTLDLQSLPKQIFNNTLLANPDVHVWLDRGWQGISRGKEMLMAWITPST